MAKPAPVRGVKLADAARVLSRLERKRVTPSQVRTMLVLGSDACALHPQRQGATRPFTADDLSIARVLMQLRKAGVSAVVARIIVEHCREGLIDAWRKQLPMALAVIGRRGLLLWRGQEPAGAVAWIDLVDVRRGVDAALAKETHTLAAIHTQDEVHAHT
jgi:hypothetical protein